MTEIHERLQPVAEVGENGSNGDEDSINGDQPVIPLGIIELYHYLNLNSC